MTCRAALAEPPYGAVERPRLGADLRPAPPPAAISAGPGCHLQRLRAASLRAWL